MGYELHIERPDGFLSFDEWIASVDQSADVRLATGEMIIRDPEPGETTSWKLPEGTVEMRFDGEWMPVFYWNGGNVNFQLGSDEERVLQVALDLSSRMNARIVGDGGEEYTQVADLVPPEFR